MDELLRKLLSRLALIGDEHEELYDSDVSQAIGNAVMDGFVRAEAGYAIPTEFGMYSLEANAAVRAAVADYVAAANAIASELGIGRFHERLELVQNRNVRTQDGHDYEYFMGHSPPDFYDASGHVIRTY